MYRFTNLASFHLNCKCLETTFAVWFHHIKNKAPALDPDCSELKCKCTTFCPPAWKIIFYVSRSSNTPSEGAVVKKTAQVDFGMCIYKKKNIICVSGTSCLRGYGFALCEEHLLLFHCCSLDLASHETAKCRSE